MKQIILFISLFLISILIINAQEEIMQPQVLDQTITDSVIDEEQTNKELDVRAGLTPDSYFYFMDEWLESQSKDNPEKVMQYRKEKIAESLAMAKKGKKDEAKQSLSKAQEYGKFVEKEASPLLAKETMQS